MMKLVKTVLGLLLVCNLCGCSGTSSEESSGDSPKESTAEKTPASPSKSEEEPAAGGKVVESSFGKGEGVLGDTMKTAFLEFTLNSAKLVNSWQSVIPDQGMKLLVLNITTKSTQSKELTLYDTDYQVQWGGTGPEDYSTPLTYRDEWATAPTYKRTVNLDGVQGMFPGTATLVKDEPQSADFIYQVPEGFTDFILQFQEFFGDESLGDIFIVTFHADLETE